MLSIHTIASSQLSKCFDSEALFVLSHGSGIVDHLHRSASVLLMRQVVGGCQPCRAQLCCFVYTVLPPVWSHNLLDVSATCIASGDVFYVTSVGYALEPGQAVAQDLPHFGHIIVGTHCDFGQASKFEHALGE